MVEIFTTYKDFFKFVDDCEFNSTIRDKKLYNESNNLIAVLVID